MQQSAGVNQVGMHTAAFPCCALNTVEQQVCGSSACSCSCPSCMYQQAVTFDATAAWVQPVVAVDALVLFAAHYSLTH